MELGYKVPSDLTAPIHNKALPPSPAQPEPCFDSDYMDGTVQAHECANPGRDQDRSRLDECRPSSYSYPSGAGGSEGENETAVTEGF